MSLRSTQTTNQSDILQNYVIFTSFSSWAFFTEMIFFLLFLNSSKIQRVFITVMKKFSDSIIFFLAFYSFFEKYFLNLLRLAIHPSHCILFVFFFFRINNHFLHFLLPLFFCCLISGLALISVKPGFLSLTIVRTSSSYLFLHIRLTIGLATTPSTMLLPE